MALNKFIPTSPDENIKTDSDMATAKFGHLNRLVDDINSLPTSSGLTLENPMSSLPQPIEFNGTASTLKIGTSDVIIGNNTSGYTTLFLNSTVNYAQIYYYANNNNTAHTIETTVFYNEARGQRSSGAATLIKHAIVYHAQDFPGTSRRGSISWEVQEGTFQGGCGGLTISTNGRKFVVAGYGHCNYIGANRTATDLSLPYAVRASLIATTSSGGIFSAEVSGYSKFFVNSDGNVGLNTYTPSAQLHVKGYTTTSSLSLKVENLSETLALSVTNDSKTFIKNLSLGDGNDVTSSINTPSTHKIKINIDGVDYYLLATNI